jgi:hypothetical protein
VAGFLTTTLAPVVFVVLGVAPGLGSGVAHALVGRAATARLRSLPEWRSFSRVEDRILAVAAIGLILNLLGFLHPRHERASSGTRPGCRRGFPPVGAGCSTPRRGDDRLVEWATRSDPGTAG